MSYFAAGDKQVRSQFDFLGVEPRYMGIAPVYAIPKVLEQAGLSKKDIDVYEVRLALCTNQSRMLIPTDQRGIRISICALRRTTGSADGKD